MQKISPILWTKDIEATIAFYTTILGFSGRSNFPDFVSLSKGNVEIMFIVPQDEPGECKDPNNKDDFFPKTILTGSIFILMEQVDEFWSKVKDKATIKTAVADREYLMRDFSILDNNGYEIVFGQDISNSKLA